MAGHYCPVFFMAKIAAVLICKDDTEEKNLDRCLSTVAPYVDGIFITGTNNPQEKIKEVCKKYNAVWSYFEWVKDFSAARNFNMSQVPKEYDWIFWLDCDDLLMGGEKLHEAAELADKNNIKAVFARYLYQVEVDEKGNIKNILIEHLRERLVKNDGTYKWVAPIHETLIAQTEAGQTDYQGFYVVHLIEEKDMIASMWRNIDILEEEVLKNPADPRPIYYLAKAYFDTKIPEIMYEPTGKDSDSVVIELLKDYLRKSGWIEERAQAWEYLSMIHRERNEYKKSLTCLFESLGECPTFPSTYIQLSLTYVLMHNWAYAMHWIKLAGSVEMPKTTLVINPRDYKSLMLEALYNIYSNTGKLEEGLKVAKDLYELIPSELNKGRYLTMEDLKRRNDVAHYVVKLAHHLRATNQPTQLQALVNSIPKEIAMEPALVALKNEMIPPKTWGSDEVVIFCGAGWEQWSPKNVSKGIGGSEEAVIYLSKELAKLGWKVTVFADPQHDAGYYDGVNYVPYYFINWSDTFNVFISWRQIGVFDMNVKAKKTYLWNHDIQNPTTYTKERVEKIDKVIFLSKWHRSNVPDLPEEKVMYSTNGINV